MKIVNLFILLFLSSFILAQTQIGADIDGEAAIDLFGISVSLSSDGTRVAIGGVNSDETGMNAGHARIYEESGGLWTQIGSDIDGEAAGDNSGRIVRLSSDGTRVAIGAINNDGTASNAGHVRIYEESGGLWTQIGSDIDGEAAMDYSGSVSLSADGKRVAIGGPENDDAGIDAGHVRIYEESGGLWTQIGSDIDGEAAGDELGVSVSLSSNGTRVAIGALRNDGTASNAGHVRIYEESGGLWTQIGSDIDGEAADDMSGSSVSLSSDGTRVAIGAFDNEGTGNSAGHTRIYEESGGVWTQLGIDIDGEAAGDNSGVSVSLSSDGTRVAIGAVGNNDAGLSAGHARVYRLEILLPIELKKFEGQAQKAGNLIHWLTASEVNASHFELQSATDGLNFKTLESINAKGSTSSPASYQYLDRSAASGLSYYRLKQVDQNGSFEFSNIIVLKRPPANEISIHPNPAKNHLNLRLEAATNTEIQATIYDALGRKISSQTLLLDYAVFTHNFDISALPKGIYFIELQGNNIDFKQKFMKID